ncbi:MAG: YdcF family protein [Xanthobacteraceae bacterium]
MLWTVSDLFEPADAIAVLGGGVDLRPFLAADLYKKGLANKILVANVKLSPIEKLGIVPPHTDLNRHVLLKLGVPEEAIIGFGSDVSSTFEESRALAVWAKETGARTIIVPTEIFSTRRQRWILNHELTAVGAHVIIDAHKPLEYDVDNWWQHEEGLIDFQNEVIKYIYYRLKY